MGRTISALALAACLATPVQADPQTPKPGPAAPVLSAAAITPVVGPADRPDMRLFLLQATSFVSAVGLVTGTPLLPLPAR